MARSTRRRVERLRSDRGSRRWTDARRIVGSMLILVGSVMAVAHLIAHLAEMRVKGALDVLIGYPMAAILVVLGLLLFGWDSAPPRPRPHQRSSR